MFFLLYYFTYLLQPDISQLIFKSQEAITNMNQEEEVFMIGTFDNSNDRDNIRKDMVSGGEYEIFSESSLATDIADGITMARNFLDESIKNDSCRIEVCHRPIRTYGISTRVNRINL